MKVGSSELARVQGQLCVSAYRYLRGLNREISDLEVSEDQLLNDFKH